MNLRTLASLASLAASAFPLAAQSTSQATHESIRQEIRQAIARGNSWLKSKQQAEGFWDTADLPALTALALNAGVRDPAVDVSNPLPPHLEKGFAWLLAQQKEDGGIYNRGLTVYNTATAVSALCAADTGRFAPAIVKARKHLVENQWDIGEKGKTDNPNDGGIGYGSNKEHTDLSNTNLAIEALALSRKYIEDGRFGKQPDLDWDAAVKFLSRCQNLEQTNDQPWASDDPQNKGGFAYSPFESKAGEATNPEGRKALRSYGSMSYAGLLSMIYAKLSPADPRVVAVREWLSKHYTLDENPGMGTQGLYYYYHTMSKALSAANIDSLPLADGKKADWRNDLAVTLLSRQREDGSWVNDNGRWMESNPVLVTSFTLLALAQIHDSIP